jgi:hypothetical protein
MSKVSWKEVPSETTSFNLNENDNDHDHFYSLNGNRRLSNAGYNSISQEDPFGTPTIGNSPYSQNSKHHLFKEKISSFFSSIYDPLYSFFVKYELYIATTCLIISTATERVTFKFMIDRMLPFKFVLIEIIFFLSFLLFSCITMYKVHRTKEITSQMKQFPHKQIWIMAILDSLQFVGLVYSGVNVSPTMTVILMHTSTLMVVAGSHIVFPYRN